MGLFNKPDAELNVEFFDDPSQTLQEGLVSVRYTLRNGGSDRIARDVSQYLGKVHYCLGPGVPADRLQSTVIEALESGISKSTNLMVGDDYALRWVEAPGNPTKFCRAKFYPNRPPTTKFSHGGEDYYAPMSCLAFLQYIIDHLNEEDLAIFAKHLTD